MKKTTFHFLATLFISQCYTTLLETAERHGGSLPRRTNIILEEFCNLPALGDIVPMITAARSRNIRLHMVIQSYGQLVEKVRRKCEPRHSRQLRKHDLSSHAEMDF